MKRLIALGADKTVRNKHGQNLLQAAIISNKLDVFVYLLNLLDPNERCENGSTALIAAVQFGYFEQKRAVRAAAARVSGGRTQRRRQRGKHGTSLVSSLRASQTDVLSAYERTRQQSSQQHQKAARRHRKGRIESRNTSLVREFTSATKTVCCRSLQSNFLFGSENRNSNWPQSSS